MPESPRPPLASAQHPECAVPTSPHEPPAPIPMSENVRQCPIPPKNSSQTPPPTPPPPLSLRQQAALARLLAGEPLGDIARALEIDPRTLYRWRHHHPAFTAELTRRQRELWGDLADDLRGAVADGVGTLRGHLVNHDPMTQLRAARFLVNLVNADRLRPTGATTVDGVLDEMLRESTSPPATPEHQAQRRALLDRLLADPDINPAT